MRNTLKEEPPFNPLDKLNLGIAVRDALLKRPVVTLTPERFKGAGVYALYYQIRSAWDVLHPRRPWASKCAENPRTAENYIRDITTFLDKTMTGH